MRAAWLVGAAALAAAAPAAAQKRTTVAPYIELGQTVDWDITGDDVLTYSTVAAGIDAAVQGQRADAQVSYRYERRIAWAEDVADNDIHTGLARAAVAVTPSLSMEAGAIAQRARSDIGGAAPGNLVGNVDNISQVYAVYAGPALSTRAGPLNIAGSYTYGYTKVEVPDGGTGLSPGTPRRDYYDDSHGQVATASVGVAAGEVAPVGLTVSGAWVREDAGQLDQRFEGAYGRADVVAPVSRTVALQAGVGYEKIETSERAALLGPGGQPVVDGNGRFVTDPASRRRIAYRTDGVFWDAGVIWRPNMRTTIEGRIGERYGSTSFTGSIQWQAGPTSGLAIGVYDVVTTFGRQLRQGIANLPTSFVAQRDLFGQQFGGCTFGTQGSAPGGCLNDVFQSINTASFRARGIDGIYFVTRGLSTFGVGGGYANRKLFVPDLPVGAVAYGFEDESYYAQGFYSRTLSPVSSFDANIFANWYDAPLSPSVFSAGATAGYFHGFGRLSTIAQLGLYTFTTDDQDAWSAQALLGARYTF